MDRILAHTRPLTLAGIPLYIRRTTCPRKSEIKRQTKSQDTETIGMSGHSVIQILAVKKLTTGKIRKQYKYINRKQSFTNVKGK